MTNLRLPHDPYNVIITGVGGQGNVLASRVLGSILVSKGFCVTIGETFGLSQRGGSVMSHLRISAEADWSPQIPSGRAHLVLALEPLEAIRVLGGYGNPGVLTLCNTRPVPPVSVIAGEASYPSLAELTAAIRELSHKAWFFEMTAAAMQLGNPIFSNLMMLAALAALELLPLTREDFAAEITRTLPPARAAINLQAFDSGWTLARGTAPLS